MHSASTPKKNPLRMRVFKCVTFDSFVESIRGNINEPPTRVDGDTTHLLLKLCRGFLSCEEHNEAMRRVIIDELLPSIGVQSVKELFIGLLNEYPAGYQHQSAENVRSVRF